MKQFVTENRAACLHTVKLVWIKDKQHVLSHQKDYVLWNKRSIHNNYNYQLHLFDKHFINKMSFSQPVISEHLMNFCWFMLIWFNRTVLLQNIKHLSSLKSPPLKHVLLLDCHVVLLLCFSELTLNLSLTPAGLMTSQPVWSQSWSSMRLTQVWCGNLKPPEHKHWEWTLQWSSSTLQTKHI